MAPILLHRKKADSDDIWDDSLLIKAYEDSLKLHKEDVAKRIAMATNKRPENEEIESELKVGSFVRSTYEDGIDYEAEIIEIYDNNTCKIKFLGYNNEDLVKLEDLVPSWGSATREQQKIQAEVDNEYEETEEPDEMEYFTMRNRLPRPPMPPMPPGLEGEDSEHLSAMLVSWYMSGYYTGLYYGRQQQLQEQQQQPTSTTTAASVQIQKKKRKNRI